MKRLFFIIATLLCLVGCKKEEPQVGRGGDDVILNVSETELHFYGTERSTQPFTIKSNYAWELSYHFDGDIESVSPMQGGSHDPFITIPEIIYVTVPAVVDSVEAGTKYYCGIIHIRAFDPTIPERTYQIAEVTVYRHY